ANASDVDGDSLSAANLTVEGNATVTANDDGSFTVTPEADFNGDIALSFDVSDGIEVVASGVDLAVNPVNDLPTSGNIAAITDEDTTIVVTQAQLLANAADLDGDHLVALNLVADNAEIVDNGDGTFAITPSADFNGLIDVSYDITDGDIPIGVNLALTVDPVNDAPIISADIPITIEEDGSYTITQAELLQFATDIEDHHMTADLTPQGSETNISGVVLDASTSDGVEGAVVTLADASGNTSTTMTDSDGHYSVTGQIVGEGSVTIEQEGMVTINTSVIEGESANNGVSALSEVMDATDMRVVVTWGNEPEDLDNHAWLFDPDSGEELDHIFYQDMSHQLDDGMVSQDVDDVDGHGPETIFIPNFETVDMHYSVHNYTGEYTDVFWPTPGMDEVRVEVYVGDQLVQSFSPEAPEGDSGEHWHVFHLVDGVIVPDNHLGNENDFVMPEIEDVTADPNAIVISDIFTQAEDNIDQTEMTDPLPIFDENEGIEGAEVDNETDIAEEDLANEDEGNFVSISEINMSNGVITDNGDGTYTIVPNDNFNGEFSIDYLVIDELGAESPAQIDVTVTPVNDAAVVEDVGYVIEEDGSLTFTDAQLLSGATDIDGDDLSVAEVSYTGTAGVFTDNGDGTYTFAPNDNFNG
ncbi:tandem-95 repeat protein, partial [uncultured Shewanella sp.]|uniref:tandem-95 repeat protein n=1 Tax=uncultured Shewanella sp. TaxID=173975 RepID=UPI00262B19D2